MPSVEQSQRASLQAWLIQARTLVTRRMRDARAHAEGGMITDAADRLDELKRSIADDILRPARRSFYVEAFQDQKSELDPGIVDYTVGPTPEGSFAATRAPIAGIDQYRAVAAKVDVAAEQLTLANGITGSWSGSQARSAYHQEWERRHRETIIGEVIGALSDAQISLHNAIGELLIRPEIR